jgi:hypothetical protein
MEEVISWILRTAAVGVLPPSATVMGEGLSRISGIPSTTGAKTPLMVLIVLGSTRRRVAPAKRFVTVAAPR